MSSGDGRPRPMRTLRNRLAMRANGAAPQGLKAVAVIRRTNLWIFHLHEVMLFGGALAAYGLYDMLHLEMRAPLKLFVERSISLGSYYLIALPLTALILRLGHLR